MSKVVGEGIDPFDDAVQEDVEVRICLQEAVLAASLCMMLLGRRFSESHPVLRVVISRRMWLGVLSRFLQVLCCNIRHKSTGCCKSPGPFVF